VVISLDLPSCFQFKAGHLGMYVSSASLILTKKMFQFSPSAIVLLSYNVLAFLAPNADRRLVRWGHKAGLESQLNLL